MIKHINKQQTICDGQHFDRQLVYIALGSNQQDPELQVKLAMAAISNIDGVTLQKTSTLYWTKPVGFLEQPDFVNAVIEVTTALEPEVLLQQLLSLELKHGRVRTAEKNGPRVIDLDILLYGDMRYHSETLTIPHPKMWERDFVTKPLFEIAPHLMLNLNSAVDPTAEFRLKLAPLELELG